MRTRQSQENIVALSDIRKSRQSALSPYGPVRAGLTTLPRTNAEAQLMELLNSLENKVHDLNYKSFEVYSTLTIAIEAIRVALSDTAIEKGGTE